MHITFEKASDSKHVYQLLYTYLGESLQYNEGKNSLYLCTDTMEIHTIDTYVVPVLTEFIVQVKEPEFIQQILSTVFYYDDESEQQQIIQMVQSLASENESYIHPSLNEGYRLEEMIHQSLTMFLTKHIEFSFESFVKFRLKDYFNRLIDYVEVGIDEYKLEQEYQDFIENLRKYITSKCPTIHLIHVVHKYDQFLFFDENYNSFTVNIEELDEDFISFQGFEVDKELIAPLLLICPSKVYLYSIELDQGIIQTLLSIFQDRVHIFPYENFIEKQH